MKYFVFGGYRTCMIRTKLMVCFQNGWTPLHCASRAGCFDVVRLLVDSGAHPKAETNLGSSPIWFAASEGHNDVLEYLMTKDHDTYSLMEDRRVSYPASILYVAATALLIIGVFLFQFVYNLMVCGKTHNNRPIEEFVLVSPAPVDTAAKLSAIFINLSSKVRPEHTDVR